MIRGGRLRANEQGSKASWHEPAAPPSRTLPDSPWLFCQKDGKRILSIQTSFEHALLVAGIVGFRIHDLRHTCGSWLVQAGVPLLEIASVLGHKDIKATMRYAHLAPENMRQAVSVLDGLTTLDQDSSLFKDAA